jgi:cytoskeletal protein CcmA (bactofilin family)
MPIFKREQDAPVAPQPPAATRPPAAPMPERTEKVAMSAPTPTVSSTSVARSADAPPAQPVVTQAVKRETAAVIDKKTQITGTLHSQGNILIEGGFQGEMEAKETISVEKGAQAQGQLRANEAVISGTYDGEIECQHRLQIAASATVTGEIKTPVLVIEEGATINCRFSMARSGR